jgi:hypothetical protein
VRRERKEKSSICIFFGPVILVRKTFTHDLTPYAYLPASAALKIGVPCLFPDSDGSKKIEMKTYFFFLSPIKSVK